MNEMLIGTTASLSLVGLAIGCFLYMTGGRSDKWIRRFFGSLVITMTVILETVVMKNFNPWLLLIYPILVTGFSLGYGADVPWKKIVKRSVFALTVISAGGLFLVTMGSVAFPTFVLHLAVGMCTVYLGAVNPIQAASEEVFVCALLNICLLMYPFVSIIK